MKLESGQDLLHYRLIEKIGEGGMGEVWKAVDTTLDRDVAIKFIGRGFAGQTERLARFVREAKMLATLNHPNIAAVYGLHEASVSTPAPESVHFIAMELVPGEDLAQRLERGALPVEEAIDVARQVAAALEAAHEQGVIHRDLKPANIKQTPDGKIKVLDLGLAKALSPDTSGDPASVSLSPTVTAAGTVAGTLLGTAAYMSPEQAKGRPVDRRADIWAFGVVLHEMLTGKKLFEAETVSETLAAVLRDEVSVDALPSGLPASVSNLLKRCLDRDPRTRLRDIGEARIALAPESMAVGGTAVEAAADAAAPAPSTRKQTPLPWVLAALLGLVAALAFWSGRGTDGTAELLNLVAPIPEDLRVPADQMGVMALAPDGKTLALVLRGDTDKKLYVRRLDSAELVPMAGTENAATPFFSPDGQWVAFFADDKLKKVPVTGGAPVTLCDSDGANRGASWGTDDFIVFSPHYTQPLMRVPGAGGEPVVLTSIDKSKGERTHRWPQAVPGEDLVLYTVGTMDSPESYDDARIDAIRPSTGEQRTVLERASMARYVASGHLVFGREGFLFAVPFDVDSLEVRGSPVPVMEEVMGERSSGVVHAEFASNGLMAYIHGVPQSQASRLVWWDRNGGTEPLPAPVAGYLNPRISPDRKKIVAQVRGQTTFDISIFDIEQETLTRLTFEGDNTDPTWSPDGRLISFASIRNNALMSAYVKAADGSGQAELLYAPEGENAGQVIPCGWSPDGRSMIMEFSNENATNIGNFSVDDGEFQVLLETPASEQTPALSPNGRWLAYASDENADYQVFVQAYPGPGGKWQVSTRGGVGPHWSPDGKELFYRWQHELYVVSVDDSSGSFRAGRPEVVLEDLPSSAALASDFDVLDSTRFLVVEPAGSDTAPAGVTVVVNWLDDLRRRVSTD